MPDLPTPSPTPEGTCDFSEADRTQPHRQDVWCINWRPLPEPSPGTEKEKEMDTTDTLLWAFEHFYHLDCANAKIHCAPVRFSPLTFRLAEALERHWREGVDWTQEMGQVLHDKGRYPEDPGRD